MLRATLRAKSNVSVVQSLARRPRMARKRIFARHLPFVVLVDDVSGVVPDVLLDVEPVPVLPDVVPVPLVLPDMDPVPLALPDVDPVPVALLLLVSAGGLLDGEVEDEAADEGEVLEDGDVLDDEDDAGGDVDGAGTTVVDEDELAPGVVVEAERSRSPQAASPRVVVAATATMSMRFIVKILCGCGPLHPPI